MMMTVELHVPAAHGFSAGRTGWGSARRADKAAAARALTGRTDTASSTAWAEDLWESHGTPVYWMAYAVLGDETAAMQAVALGMVDHVRRDHENTPADEVRRALARHVYLRSAELASQSSASTKPPPLMEQLAQIARLQRASLALCTYGGHTYGEAAEVLGISPHTAAQLLTAGLHELSRLPMPLTAN